MTNSDDKQATQDARALSWLRVPDDPQVPDDVKALRARPLEKMGFVPNDSPMRGPSNLSKAQREMIAVVVSTANRCHY